MKNLVNVLVLLVCVGTFLSGHYVLAEEPAVTEQKPEREYGGETVYGDRLLYNGNQTYTFFPIGKVTWPLYVSAHKITLIKDASEDKPMRVVFGQWSSWYGQYDEIVIHLHDAREIGGAGWTYKSGKSTRHHYNVNVVE